MTQKTDGWQIRLCQYLGEAGRTPFAYGSHDCALFSAGAVLAMTGLDLAEGWRGRYSTLRGGLRVLRASGHGDHIALAAVHFADVARPEPGDLAVVPGDDGAALGVVQGAMIYVLRPDGLGLVSADFATRFLGV